MNRAAGYVELGSDEGAFVIRGDMGSLDAEPWDENTLVTVPDDVQATGYVLILTGDQWGPFAVTTHVLDSRPEPDPEWEDVVEFSLTCSGGLVVAELVNHDPSTGLLNEPGTYRVRVSAKGRTEAYKFDDEDLDDHSGPVEHYLVQAWLAPPTRPEVIRETSSFARAQLSEPKPEPIIEGEEAGLAAAAGIGRDVDGGEGSRALSGDTGTVVVSRRIPQTRTRLFAYMRFGFPMSRHVPSWGFMSGPDFEDIGAETYANAPEGHPVQLGGRRGVIRSIVVEEDRPKLRVRKWAWILPPAPGVLASVEERETLFREDSTITMTYTQTKDDDGQVWTHVELEHAGLPIEWLDDTAVWWRYQLAFMEQFASEQYGKP